MQILGDLQQILCSKLCMNHSLEVHRRHPMNSLYGHQSNATPSCPALPCSECSATVFLLMLMFVLLHLPGMQQLKLLLMLV